MLFFQTIWIWGVFIVSYTLFPLFHHIPPIIAGLLWAIFERDSCLSPPIPPFLSLLSSRLCFCRLFSVSQRLPAGPTAANASDIPQFPVWLGFGGKHRSLELLPPPQMIGSLHRPRVEHVSVSTHQHTFYNWEDLDYYKLLLYLYAVIWLMFYRFMRWIIWSVWVKKFMCEYLYSDLLWLLFCSMGTTTLSILTPLMIIEILSMCLFEPDMG